MRVFSFSYCFPNHDNPTWGMFVLQRLAALSKKVELKVCSPVPWFPWVSRHRGEYGPEKETWEGLTVYRPDFFYFPGILKNYDGRLYARGVLKWGKKVFRSWRPDLLDAHFIWPDGVGVSLMADRMKIPYVITLRGKLYECLPIKSQRIQCGKALRGAAKVISVSGKLASAAMELGVPQERISVIPNGVDKQRFQPRDKLAARRLLKLPEEGKLLVTVSHLGCRKGHYEVIRALAGLSDKNVRLLIVGGEAQGGTAEDIMNFARSLGAGDKVIVAGRQPYEKIPYYFNAADASILASYREGCPNAVLESLACGTPVVASDVGAVPDILPVPEAGRIVPPKTVEPLQTAIEETLSRTWEPDKVTLSSNVKSWEEVAEHLVAILNGN